MTTKILKQNKLAAFGGGKSAAVAEPVPNPERRRRGSGEMVQITVRVNKANWMKLRQFAMMEGETLQTMAVDGFNRVLATKGLPPLEV